MGCHLFDIRNVQVAVVGDFLPLELEDALLRYIGTVPTTAAWPPPPPALEQPDNISGVDVGPSTSTSTSSSTSSSSTSQSREEEKNVPTETQLTTIHQPNPALSIFAEGPIPIDVVAGPRLKWTHINDDEPRCSVHISFPMFTRWGRHGPTLEAMVQREVAQLRERLSAAESPDVGSCWVGGRGREVVP